ncbi:RNA 2'-phosphotransferase [Aquimarina mytili]|uniref:Probable RNA 2'-phosphotransferase n=1 Tax=Aquimarina mytili TaxID=874423 RepID=A0A937A0F6_9FLAO|nr:RNA 2'-phosphotransferase [Aquimarina mytili]MBL0685313.1 RNA 2'-phosphotransferase [Aquimarina mytili]
MNKTQTQIRKLISYWLRHKPEDENIILDEFGWANIKDILAALKANNIQSTQNDLIELSNSFNKIRWKIDELNHKIKATHGHSICILQELESQTPPEVLYHGTATKFLESIMANGLKSKQRQYVHLSEAIDMAKDVGSRHGKPFIIEINTKKLIEEGWKFYKTEQNVWLTSEIPTEYLDFEPWEFTIDQETKATFLNEFKKEIGTKHQLSNTIKDLKLFAKYGPSDDYLFKNIKSEEYFVVHLTWSGKKEKEGWPSIERYDSLQDFINKRLVPNQADWYI